MVISRWRGVARSLGDTFREVGADCRTPGGQPKAKTPGGLEAVRAVDPRAVPDPPPGPHPAPAAGVYDR